MLRSFYILSKKTHELIGKRQEDRRMHRDILWAAIVWHRPVTIFSNSYLTFLAWLEFISIHLDSVGTGQDHTMSDTEGCVIFRHLPHEHGFRVLTPMAPS